MAIERDPCEVCDQMTCGCRVCSGCDEKFPADDVCEDCYECAECCTCELDDLDSDEDDD